MNKINLYQKAEGVPDNRRDTAYFCIAISCAVFGAIFWCYFNFLTAEDSLVLFNRYNFLKDAPIHFYYAGYWSAFPQSVAFLVSPFNPAIQAITYSLVALVIFLILLQEIFRATKSGLTAVVVAVVVATIAPFMLFSLTYTFWPGLAILGLVGLRTSHEDSDLSIRDLLICIPGLTGSPLGLLFLPLFCWATFRKRSLRAAAVALATFLSFFFLVERDGHRSNLEDMAVGSIQQLLQLSSGQLDQLISFSNLNSFVMGVLGLLSVVFVFLLGLLWLFRLNVGKIAALLYISCSLVTVVAAIVASNLPLSGRYWFPIVICGSVMFGSLIMTPALNNVRRFAEPLLIFVLCIGLLGGSALRLQSWGGPSYAAQEWSYITTPVDHLTALKRSWHEDANWALGLGDISIAYQECAGQWEHPSTQETYGFRIYCGNGVFE